MSRLDLGAIGDSGRSRGYLDGQMLLAMPSLQDGDFARTVIYLCAHSEDGAMGIIVNRQAPEVRFNQLLVQLKIVKNEDQILLPREAGEPPVLRGGPVESGRGFVLHSSDFFIDNSTLPIADNICLTATLDILRAIAHGKGPRKAVLALGYAGWSPGQLEGEIRANGWLNCPADHGLVFGADLAAKYDQALAKLGVSLAALSAQAGQA
jgi:putative transcriptional regulator